MSDRAVVLLSGGLDSSTVLALAVARGFETHALSFDYGQRHGVELRCASAVAEHLNAASHKVLKVDLRAVGGSALTDDIDVPAAGGSGIPVTYVPGRNTVFLSLGMAYAEAIQADDLFIGVSGVDYSGYPDCRPEFVSAFQAMANLATKRAVEGTKFQIHAPLQFLGKAQTIKLGHRLGVDYSMTFSCYNPQGSEPCGECDSCVLRQKGFDECSST